jgi:hypothetical protein
MKQNETKLGEKREKREEKYVCKICDYKSCIKYSYDRHLLTPKHLIQSKNETNETNETKKEEKKEKKEKKEKNISNNICQCGLVYYSRTTLWRHKKKCNIIVKAEDIEQNINNEDTEKKQNKDELICYLIKENQEFKNLILEIVKKDSYNTTNNINSYNKSFNLNFFLNETCKDAMNITDFVDSIKLQLSDLERVGEMGYIEGISNIIVKNLKQLDVTQRPVHCTDKKRETIYIKDDDKWEKDDEKEKMHKIVRKVADKNARMLPKFKEAHPDCNKASSKYSDAYNKIIVESMGGSGDNNFEKEEKIIKKVAKEITVEKDDY